MCGIAGYVIASAGDREVGRGALESMTRALTHRGPDDEGYRWSPRVGLGSRRLSILDLSPAGRMPIENETGSIAVVQNGEIYNFRALRADLEARGHHFASHSDTEVIVHLYEELGEACCERFDGMFALAIWDEPRRRLLLARDRFGEKPLYYQVGADGLAFSSELRALRLYPGFRGELDLAALEQFLLLGYIPAPQTPFRNVFKLPPGHWLTFDQETAAIAIRPYWSFPPLEERAMSEADATAAFKEILFDSVSSRLVSDVPVGAFLSGGVDSSLVVAAMAKVRGDAGNVRTISIGSRTSRDKDETGFAADVARALGVDHSSLSVTFEDVAGVIERLPELLDEPLGDPAALSTYLITRFARENGLTVLLSGDAGDELFLGYPVYRWIEWFGAVERVPPVVRSGISATVSLLSTALGRSRLQKAATALRQPDLLHAAYYLSSHGAWTVDEVRRLRGKASIDLEGRAFSEAFGNGAGRARPMVREARALLGAYLPDNNLARMDRFSMANGVETRAPFLDPRFAELAAALPLELKIRGAVRKYLPKRVLAELLPASVGDVLNRPKHGFDALPMAAWLRGELRALVDSYLDPARLRRQGLFEPALIERAVAEHSRGERFNHWWKLWLMINLEMWLERWGGV